MESDEDSDSFVFKPKPTPTRTEEDIIIIDNTRPVQNPEHPQLKPILCKRGRTRTPATVDLTEDASDFASIKNAYIDRDLIQRRNASRKVYNDKRTAYQQNCY